MAKPCPYLNEQQAKDAQRLINLSQIFNRIVIQLH